MNSFKKTQPQGWVFYYKKPPLNLGVVFIFSRVILIDSFHVFFSIGIDADNVAFIDKERSIDLGASL